MNYTLEEKITIICIRISTTLYCRYAIEDNQSFAYRNIDGMECYGIITRWSGEDNQVEENNRTLGKFSNKTSLLEALEALNETIDHLQLGRYRG